MGKYEIKLPEAVEFIINRLNQKGHRADIVGGPVRDHILGKNPEDYDITTDALPEQTKEAFAELRVIETGIKHGTVTLLIDGEGYEVTTYRIDGEYKDARHPERVEFTADIKEDLSRRDFTMNAIAYNHTDGITDPFFGEADIKAGLIRAVRDPEKRFSEDALRILRCIRFSSTLGFDIENGTRIGVFAKKHLLSKVSKERIYTEWRKLLSGCSALSVFDEYREVIAEFLPEIKDSPLPDGELFYSSDYQARLLSFFSLSGLSGDSFYRAMKRLKTDSSTAEDGRAVLDAQGKYELDKLSSVGRLLYDLGEDRSRLLVRLEILLGKYESDVYRVLDSYISSGKPYLLNGLMLKGEDVKNMGISGRNIKAALEYALFKVIDGERENEKDALITLLFSNLSEFT